MPAEKISPRQSLQLLILTVLPTAFLFLPALAGKVAKEDAWLTPILATFGGFYLAGVIYFLAKKYPDEGLFQWMESILGGVVGKGVILAYIAWFIHTNAVILAESTSFVSAVFLPHTPHLAISLLFLIVLCFSALQGIEVLARLAELFFPLFTILVIMLVVLAIPIMKPSFLLPVLAEGWGPVVKGSIVPFAWRGELIMAGVILPFITRPICIRWRRQGFWD